MMKYYQIMASSDYQKYSCSFYHANILFCMNQIMASVGYQKCTAKLKVQYQLFRCKIKLGKFIPCSRPLSTVLVSQSKASTGSFLHQAHMHTVYFDRNNQNLLFTRRRGSFLQQPHMDTGSFFTETMQTGSFDTNNQILFFTRHTCTHRFF